MSVLDQLARMVDEMSASGRTPARIVIGNEDAAELEEELNRYRFSLGDPPEPYVDVVNLKGPATLFDIEVKRVDQPRLIGVIAKGCEGVADGLASDC